MPRNRKDRLAGEPYRPRRRRTTAVILAAGAGTRLGDLGHTHSKATVTVAGRPLIAWVMESLGRAAIDRIVVVGHPSDASLSAFLATMPAEVVYLLQPERLGIADALRHALPVVERLPGYLACACDSVFPPADVARVVGRGRRHPGCAVVGVLAMGTAATQARSAVRLDGERIVEIIEKPAAGATKSGLVAMPLYWLPRQFNRYLDRVPSLRNERHVSTALSAFLGDGGVVHAVPVRERVEVTTMEDVERAAERLPEMLRG